MLPSSSISTPIGTRGHRRGRAGLVDMSTKPLSRLRFDARKKTIVCQVAVELAASTDGIPVRRQRTI